MKKIVLLLLMAVMTLGAHAQFKKDTHYLNASLSGFGIGFDKGNFSIGEILCGFRLFAVPFLWWPANLLQELL